MSFRITGLPPAPFSPLFGLSEQELAARQIRRYVAVPGSQFPDRIELRDVSPGQTVLLLNYTHQPAATPYQSSHAIFVREGATTAYDRIDEVPAALRIRTLSLRAFDADGDMVEGDLTEGHEVERLIERFFANPAAAYIQAHYATRGCYAARIERT